MSVARRLDLFLTEACNLACSYYFARTRAANSGINPALARKALDWLFDNDHNPVHVTFWGGEPEGSPGLFLAGGIHARWCLFLAA